MGAGGKMAGGGLTEAVARPLGSARVSYAVAAVLVGIWVAVEALGGPDALESIYRTLGLSRRGFFSGFVWEPLTYAFFHGSWLHVAANAGLLVMFGGRVERILGWLAALRILFGGFVLGGLFHLLLAPDGGDAAVLVGASGGVMAWLLALTTLSPESRMWPLPLSGRNAGLGLLIGSGLLALCHPALGIPGFSWLGRMAVGAGLGSMAGIGHACHFGGGLAGWVAGRWILRPRLTKDDLARARRRRERGG